MANSFETELEAPEYETLASLAQNLVYRLPGCDDTTIRLTLREVYLDFCRRSCCLRVRRLFPASPNGRYPVFASRGGTVRNVTEVCLRGRLLREGRDWRMDGNGAVFVDPRLVRANDEPPRCGRKCEPVEIAWIEVPALGSEEVPRGFIGRYGEAMCAGVMARLLGIANKAWSDPQMAAVEGSRYEAMVNEERQKLYSPSGSGAMGDVFDTSSLI